MLPLSDPPDRALKGGANRLEICGNLGVGGGTTPSFGAVQAIKTYTDEHYPDVELMVSRCSHPCFQFPFYLVAMSSRR